MGELSNALQGKMNSRKSHIKDPSERQLDLFSSLSDRTKTSPKIISPKPEPRPELEMVLPAAKGGPPDVSADVRAVLSESGLSRASEFSTSDEAARPLPPTGIYRRPRQPPAPLAAPLPPPRAPSGPRVPARSQIRAWFSGVELDRRIVSLVVVLVLLVALISFWTACPRTTPADSGTSINLAEMQPGPEPVAPISPPGSSSAPAPAPASPAALTAADWKIAGAETFLNGGVYLVRFTDPVFVSTDKISIEGMRALKAVAAKLVSLEAGARVIVTGYTDDVPLSRPTPGFADNADLAAARAKVALEHLALFARANKKLAFEPATGDPARAPYPNDGPANRRLNRTATVQVMRAGQ